MTMARRLVGTERDARMNRIVWIALVVFCTIVVLAYVGAKYFNDFNNFAASPNCKYNCWENGKRVR